MNVSIPALAWRTLLRDWRAGELRLLALAVVLAVAALTAVGFFADRLNGALLRDATQLLGGDVVVSADRPLPPDYETQARAMGLTTASSAVFPSMARAADAQGGAVRLSALKAVSAAYPLRGSLTLKPDFAAREEVVAGPPPKGTVWAEQALLEALNLKVGDHLLLGDARLRIDRILVLEPDRGSGFMNFAPRVLLHLDDLPATGLIQPASRVTWRLAAAAPRGAEARAQDFRRYIDERVAAGGTRGLRVDTLETGRPEMRQTLDRAQRFLNLVALLAALLAAVAVAIAARDYAQRHLDASAMLRVLGAPQRAIAGAHALQFGLVGLMASAAGAAAGWALHHVFVLLLKGLVGQDLPPAGWGPALFGLGVGMTLLGAFGLPPVLQLAQVPPLRVIRRDVGGLRPASVLVLGGGAIGFGALLLAAAQDLRLGAMAVGGFAAATAVFALTAWVVVLGLRRLVADGHAAGRSSLAARAPRWLLLATRQVAARPAFAVLQVSALAVGLLALTLLVLLRTDLIGAWRDAAPPDAPNRFIINLQPDQGDAFQTLLREQGVKPLDWYPMFRGRLVAINGQEVRPESFTDDRPRRLVEREFNLSHAARQPPHNLVSGGRWQPDEADAVSVEEGLAQTLGVKLGDRLTFDVAGQRHEGRITSLRKVDWGSMRVNFFVMFPRARFDGLPVTWISAFRAPPTAGFDSLVQRRFPNVTNVDVSASVAQVQRVLDQVIRAVEFLFAFTMAAGMVVLFAAVSATRETRTREFALMRAMGAGASLLGQVQRAELLGVGALAGAMAALAAMLIGGVLARYAFEFAWAPPLWVPLAGTAAGALLALAAGWWGLRGVLRRPVMETLRQSAER
ncbi:MAG: ABC transporter permease [Aquabacterium sp.]